VGVSNINRTKTPGNLTWRAPEKTDRKQVNSTVLSTGIFGFLRHSKQRRGACRTGPDPGRLLRLLDYPSARLLRSRACFRFIEQQQSTLNATPVSTPSRDRKISLPTRSVYNNSRPDAHAPNCKTSQCTQCSLRQVRRLLLPCGLGPSDGRKPKRKTLNSPSPYTFSPVLSTITQQ